MTFSAVSHFWRKVPLSWAAGIPYQSRPGAWGKTTLSLLHNWIENKTTLLDLGCGDGSMLLHFQKVKQIQGLGIEINADNIQKCLEKGVNVIEHNIDKGLGAISNNSFDIVLMSHTIQTLKSPLLALEEITRIGKKCIVTKEINQEGFSEK